jgi:hypothetical protein
LATPLSTEKVVAVLRQSGFRVESFTRSEFCGLRDEVGGRTVARISNERTGSYDKVRNEEGHASCTIWAKRFLGRV